jgi:hypothetical protein
MQDAWFYHLSDVLADALGLDKKTICSLDVHISPEGCDVRAELRPSGEQGERLTKIFRAVAFKPVDFLVVVDETAPVSNETWDALERGILTR